VISGDLVDICAGNALDDITGAPRPLIDDATRASAIAANVERQQVKLNELFAGFGFSDALDVDGISGPLTGQRLCAARLALGLNPAIADMAPGSSEQAALFASTMLPTPASTATQSERWVLIDRTCQIMFVGAREQTVFVFPTSTGSEGYETRDQDRAEAFRFNPALDNGGWHDSSEFPVGVDNPLNGNLYKPLYFDLGQAIHGANNVPPTPASKGCARLSVADHDTLIAWLGLDAATGETWRKSEMNVTVSVQGVFVPR
ncbi:MAG TPA: L,D-transpeptidase, partial [Ilumatobacteraceae bacterium]|nr:L,D-transpeptidase [Ilumatobacteraceae bacterium]